MDLAEVQSLLSPLEQCLAHGMFPRPRVCPISRGMSSLELWLHDKWHHFLEVCIHRWRIPSRAAAAARTPAPRLLRGPRNASEAKTL